MSKEPQFVRFIQDISQAMGMWHVGQRARAKALLAVVAGAMLDEATRLPADIWIESMPADGSWPDALSGGARIGIDPAATAQYEREVGR